MKVYRSVGARKPEGWEAGKRGDLERGWRLVVGG